MYDLVVIGSGPAGEKGAAQAAYFGKRVALVEREPVLGGACVNTGTIPSKTLRESALHRRLERLGRPQQRRDVLENDAGLRKIGDVADVLAKVGHGRQNLTSKSPSRPV